jgi:hypothetical protein
VEPNENDSLIWRLASLQPFLVQPFLLAWHEIWPEFLGETQIWHECVLNEGGSEFWHEIEDDVLQLWRVIEDGELELLWRVIENGL